MSNWYWPALLLKLSAAILIGILYSGVFNTHGDTFAYMIDGQALQKEMLEMPAQFCKHYFLSETEDVYWNSVVLEPRYWFLFRLLFPLLLLCGMQYYLVSFWLTLFVFYQLYLLAEAVISVYKVSTTGVLLALLLLPSVVYWSAGLNKETLLVALTAYVVRRMIAYIHEDRKLSKVELFIVMAALYIIWQVKFYFAAALLPALLLWGAFYWENKRKWLYFALGLVTMLLCFSLGNFHLSPAQFLFSLYQNYSTMIQGSPPGSYFELHDFEPSVLSLVKNAPLALWNGLFTPLPWQAHYILSLFAAIQNLLLLLLVISLLGYVRRFSTIPEFWVLMVYTLGLATFLAMSSPNWGSLLRYKMSFEPYLMLLVFGVHPWIKKFDAYFFPEQ